MADTYGTLSQQFTTDRPTASFKCPSSLELTDKAAGHFCHTYGNLEVNGITTKQHFEACTALHKGMVFLRSQPCMLTI